MFSISKYFSTEDLNERKSEKEKEKVQLASNFLNPSILLIKIHCYILLKCVI
ncbi:hypothetical protein CWI38_0113p0010 [Hamiltosporidium tvaerminnensis]|uniref:Uncharacterized protein n=1 Tax=Hamiltosporidium tvaerminnensis TaxID=1176355 RepID=A0A4V6MVP7_9MICR|nr:hypothetical protein CWI38_0113p0010 [Hamiltosporidium tvaerminnensis]